jgi:hypothetical protein
LKPGFHDRPTALDFSLIGKDALPVILHADDHPALLLRLIHQLLGKCAELGVRHSNLFGSPTLQPLKNLSRYQHSGKSLHAGIRP